MLKNKCRDLGRLPSDRAFKILNRLKFPLLFRVMAHGRKRADEFLFNLNAIHLTVAHVGFAGSHD